MRNVVWVHGCDTLSNSLEVRWIAEEGVQGLRTTHEHNTVRYSDSSDDPRPLISQQIVVAEEQIVLLNAFLEIIVVMMLATHVRLVFQR